MFKYLMLGAAAACALAPAVLAERGGDGEVKIIYWQAPSILNHYLSSGTKDIKSSSIVIEPLGRYNETGALVPYLAEDISTVANGGSAPTSPRLPGNSKMACYGLTDRL